MRSSKLAAGSCKQTDTNQSAIISLLSWEKKRRKKKKRRTKNPLET